MATLHIRNIEEETVKQLKVRARARGWTVGELIDQLVAFHSVAQEAAENGNNNLEVLLATFGLEGRRV